LASGVRKKAFHSWLQQGWAKTPFHWNGLPVHAEIALNNGTIVNKEGREVKEVVRAMHTCCIQLSGGGIRLEVILVIHQLLDLVTKAC
jgi:hypothetical protein